MPTSKSRTPAGRARVTRKSPSPARPTRGARAQARTAAAQKHAPAVVSKPVHVPEPIVLKPLKPFKAAKAGKSDKAAKVTKPAKAARPANPAKATNGAKPSKVDKPAKAGRVRDKFTMPEADYALIEKLKLTARRTGLKAKKGELLRLGLRALDGLSSTDLQDRLLTMRVHDKRSARQHAD